jgi:hypothetical protein
MFSFGSEVMNKVLIIEDSIMDRKRFAKALSKLIFEIQYSPGLVESSLLKQKESIKEWR